jgi:hypothetical protein
MPRGGTSSVIAIAKTPSLKATMRETSTPFSLRRLAARARSTTGSSTPAATEPRRRYP